MRHYFTDGPNPIEHGPCRHCGMTVAQTLLDSRYTFQCPEDTKPERDDRGRFCSFNTICGRNCTPKERDNCYWWLHARDVLAQAPFDLTPPLSHAKDDNRGK